MSAKGQYNCVLCNTKLESKEALQAHFRKHANKEIDTRGKPVKDKNDDYRCDMCEENFESVAATIRHRFKVHSNSPAKFFCHYCGMQFPLKTHRDNHQASHDPLDTENKEQYKRCEECKVLFYNEKALDYHNRSVHKRLVHLFKPIVTPPPSNKIRVNSMNDALSVYYCHLCGAEYIIKFNLQRHLERAHTQEEREFVPDNFIKCTVCSALFSTKKAYDMHNTYHQPDDLYVTSEEQRLQTVTKVDQDYDFRRVEAAADKYVPKTISPKKCTKNWSKPKRTEKVEVKQKDYSSSDDETGSINVSSDSESDLPLQQRIHS